jgi:hypothetical protein
MPTQQIEIQVQVFQDFGGQNIEYNRFKQFFTHFWLYQKWVKIVGGLYNKKIKKAILYLI